MRYSLILACIMAAFAIGCSGGSPVEPASSPDVSATGRSLSGSNGHVLWGVWDVSIDPVTMTAEVIPVRGIEFTVNVTQFMQPPKSPVQMVKIALGPGSDPVTGFFEADVTLNHPFPGLNQFNGFDVRGVLMSNGSIVGDHDSSVIRAGADDTQLLNPDGYTRWWNYPEFTSYGSIFGFTYGSMAPPNQPTATVNPYKYFCNSLEKDSAITDIDTSTRGFFPTSPGSHTRTYDIQFQVSGGKPIFDFQYAVDASWEAPDPAGAPDYPAEYYPLSANMAEAFALSVDDSGSTAFYVDPGQNGGELVLDIEVYDWQSIANPGSVPSEVSGIWLESPILPSPIDILPTATVLPGSTAVSSVFETVLGSLDLTKSGTEMIFCTVESASPDTYKPQIPSGDAFDYPDATLAAYFTFPVLIKSEPPGVTPTVISIDPEWGYQDAQLTGVTVTGEDFDPACTVKLEIVPGDELQLDNLTWIDAQNLEFDLDLTGATLGFYDVIVTNPFAAPGILDDGFEVRELIPAIWPVTQGNSAHTGYVPGLNGPTGVLGSPTWSVTWGNDTNLGNSLPVFLSETTAFLSIAYNYLDTNHLPAVAVDLATHTVKWEKRINMTSHSSVVVKGISADGSVVLVNDWPDSWMYGLDAEDGEILWQCELSGSSGSDSYATLDDNGNFIVAISVGGTGIRSIDPQDGTVNWTASIGNPGYCTPAVGPDGTVYAYSNWLVNAELHAIDPDTGADNWSSYPTFGRCDNGVVVLNNGDILVHGQSGMRCYHDNGSYYSTVWNQSYSYAWYYSPAVDPDGYIVFIDGSDTLRRLNPTTGATMGSSSGWGPYGNRIAIGDDGLIYTNSEVYFRCFNSDLTLRWSHYSGSFQWYWSAPALGQDGTVYSAARTLGLCAWHD